MRSRRWILLSMAMALPLLAGSLLFAASSPQVERVAAVMPPETMKWAFLAAALVAGMASVGAAYAVAVVGAAAMGAVAEKPETAGRALIFVGLAEGIAIYGLIIAIMILGRIP
ncbi:MAG: ATP synthase subunit C [Thermoanaerobaculia bacterium]